MMTEFTACTHCGSTEFENGPRGGAALNITCKGCGARFNVIDHPAAPRLLLHEISGPTCGS